MYQFEFTSSALRDFKRLPKQIQLIIIKKLEFFLRASDPLSYATHLINSDIGQYRFRVGDYRVVVDREEQTFVILAIGHRKDIYR